MTRSDLIKNLLDSGVDLSLDKVDEIVCHVFSFMKDALKNGEKIEIRGFGTFSIRDRKPLVARNPKTGEQINVPGKKVVYFKPGKELRDRMNSKKL